MRAVLVFSLMFLAPGWCLLALTGGWRRWEGLQRWIIAIGVSIAFYPILFYLVRPVAFLTLGPYKIGTLLLLMSVYAVWRLRHRWQELVNFDSLEWVAMAVIFMTLFVRFWSVRNLPYSNWADSLHHTLLTQLTAVQGRLPITLEPYSPSALNYYHLGLYGLSATVLYLVQIPAHLALLWTGQFLNGLSGLGVYLLLDRYVGRIAAITGLVVVGLLSFQPAFMTNWGRITQVASQTLMLIAGTVVWDALRFREECHRPAKLTLLLTNAFFPALLSASVFLLHYRVSAFYLLFLLPVVSWQIWRGRKDRAWLRVVLMCVVIAFIALLFIAPALYDVGHAFLSERLTQAEGIWGVAEKTNPYYRTSWNQVPVLVASSWLLVVASLCLVFGLARRNSMVKLSLLWAIGLYLLGNAYLLKIRVLDITNLSAALLAFYLPIGLVVGSAVHEILEIIPVSRRYAFRRIMLAILFLGGFAASHTRVADVVSFRYWITQADLDAMEWIKANTPSDAVFAINTYFWLPNAVCGADAGYWIPYFTGRKTTTDTLLYSLQPKEYVEHILALSTVVKKLESDVQVLADLRAMGVEYIYVGAMGGIDSPGLSAALLSGSELVQLLYSTEDVAIFQIR